MRRSSVVRFPPLDDDWVEVDNEDAALETTENMGPSTKLKATTRSFGDIVENHSRTSFGSLTDAGGFPDVRFGLPFASIGGLFSDMFVVFAVSTED